jgi:hypothetical protein
MTNPEKQHKAREQQLVRLRESLHNEADVVDILRGAGWVAKLKGHDLLLWCAECSREQAERDLLARGVRPDVVHLALDWHPVEDTPTPGTAG